MSKPPARLRSNNVSFTLGAAESGRTHAITVSIGIHPETGQIVEMAFCDAGKTGHGLNLLFAELGIKLSRVLQERNPETGKDLANQGEL